jgi:hypothetical protein
MIENDNSKVGKVVKMDEKLNAFSFISNFD